MLPLPGHFFHMVGFRTPDDVVYLAEASGYQIVLPEGDTYCTMDALLHNTTLGGWVAEQLGLIPAQGDTFLWEDLKVSVTKTDGRRVLEVEVRRLDEAVEVGA